MEVLNSIELRSLLLPAVLLVSFDLAAHSSLRTWLAVSALADAPAPIDEQDAKRVKRHRVRSGIAVALLCVALYALEFWVILEQNDQLTSALFGVLVGGLLTAAHFSYWSRAFGLSWAVYRLQSGRLRFRLHLTSRREKLQALAVFAWSACNAVATVLEPTNTTFKMLSTAALVFSICSKSAGKVTSIRRLTIFFIAYEAIIIALTVAVVWMSQKSEAFASVFDTPASTSTLEDDIAAVAMPAGLMTFFSHVIPAFYAAPIGYYMAACLRFDYQQYRTTLDDSSSSHSSIVLEKVPARMPRCAAASPSSNGILLPKLSNSALFPRKMSSKPYYLTTYFCTAIMLFTISPVLNYVLRTYIYDNASVDADSKPAASEYNEAQLFGMLSMFLTMPLLALAVGIQAALRGEGKALWSYSETWTKKPFRGLRAEQERLASMERSELEDGLLFKGMEKPRIVVQDMDADEVTPLITFEEVIKS